MLFGVEAPKMIVNLYTTQDEVPLDCCVILKDEPEPDSYGVKAVRTGKRVFTNAGKHWIFQIKIHLRKYDDPAAKYLELKSYEGTLVYLYRHSDGQPIYDTYNNLGKFILQSVNESYIDDYNKKDILTITFRSIDFIGKEEPIVPLPDSNMTCFTKLFADDCDGHTFYWPSQAGFDAAKYPDDDWFSLYKINNEIGNKSALKYFTTKQQIGNIGTTNKYNICVFAVGKMGGISGGNIIDFRDNSYSPSLYNLIVRARTTNSNRLSYAFSPNDSTNEDVYEDFGGYDSSVYCLKLFRFEEGKQNIYVGGGAPLLSRTNKWRPISLPNMPSAGGSIGGSSSNNNGNEQMLAHISVYIVPEGQVFLESELNAVANEIVSYYNNYLITWTDITS